MASVISREQLLTRRLDRRRTSYDPAAQKRGMWRERWLNWMSREGSRRGLEGVGGLLALPSLILSTMNEGRLLESIFDKAGFCRRAEVTLLLIVEQDSGVGLTNGA